MSNAESLNHMTGNLQSTLVPTNLRGVFQKSYVPTLIVPRPSVRSSSLNCYRT